MRMRRSCRWIPGLARVLVIDDFMKAADADWIFPMHFWGEFDVGARLKALDCSRGYRERVVEISRQGQEFSI